MHKDITDDDMPDGMVAQQGMGDIEEEIQAVTPDVDPDEVMPPAMDDSLFLDRIEREHGDMVDAIDVDEFDDFAVDRQERANRDAVGGLEATMRIDQEFDVGLTADFGVTD